MPLNYEPDSAQRAQTSAKASNLNHKWSEIRIQIFRLIQNVVIWDVIMNWNRRDWKKLDHSVVVAAITQWCCRLSACVRAHGVHM